MSSGWKKRNDKSLATWEYFKDEDQLLTLVYEGVTDLSDLPMRDFAWALYDHRENVKGQRRYTFRAGLKHRESLPRMKSFGESLLEKES